MVQSYRSSNKTIYKEDACMSKTRKKIKKMVALISCVAMLIAVFPGCANQKTAAPDKNAPAQSDGTQNQTPAAPDKKVTLTLLIGNQTTLDGLKGVMEAIEKKYNIATEIELRPGGAEGDNVVKTRLATGDMADLCFYNSGSLFQVLNPEQNFVDLTNEPFMSNVLDFFKSTVSANEKVYGIPANTVMSGGWLYNKKVYAELGLSVPKTWDELLANCEKIKGAGKTAVIGSYKDDWTSQLILLADYFNVQAQVPNFAADYTANKAKFATTPAALRGFEKLYEINKKGYMNKDFLATTYDAALKMLAEGTGVHYPMLSTSVSNIEANFPDKVNDIGFFAQPGDSADKNGLTVWTPEGIYISKNSKNIEAAKKWAEFFVSQEGIAAYVSKQKPGGPFAIKGATLPDDVFPAVKDVIQYFDAGNTAPALEFLSPIKGPNLPQICVEVGSGLKAPSVAAQEYDRDVEKQAKQLGFPGW
ncbi:ABC transporter substrate-binding protein [Petroclostridium xylanilyticum]|uniref:ABC transporter substrate-binding protein n=1 Tax=Petroclostridium xylanilyticum TaxID=1792311 RepID=UPI0018E3936F|nr:extracellular solute-binding protein [Petroclostridium xylanilyticum]